MNKNKLLIALGAVVILLAAGWYYWSKAPSGGQGTCGDGTCDSIEQSTGFCAQDCNGVPEQVNNNSASGTSGAKQEAGIAVVSVDASKSLGTFSPYLFSILEAVEKNGSSGAGFKVMEIMTSTDKNPLADACNNTTAFDNEIDKTFKMGAEPLLFFSVEAKPKDLSKFSACVKTVAQHFKDKGVRLLRFGNEPDGSWQGWAKYPATDFYETYAAFAKAVKSVDENFVLDAPGVMTPFTGGTISIQATINTNFSTQLSPWASGFLDYLNTNKIPLDIFSIHTYSPLPYEFYHNFKTIQSKMKDYPNIKSIYGTPKIANDEWSIFLGDFWSGHYSEYFDMTWSAASDINSLVNMIEQGAELSVFYSSTATGTRGCHDFLLVSCSGKAKPSYYAFQAFNQLSGTNRLSTGGTDHMNFAAISGIKESNGDKQILIVLSNYDVKTFIDKYESGKKGPNNSGNPVVTTYDNYVKNINGGKDPAVYGKFNLTVNGLPWGSSKSVLLRRYIIDDGHKLFAVDEGQTLTVSGNNSVSISADIAAPQIQIITLALKESASLFSLIPNLTADENYGSKDALGKSPTKTSGGDGGAPAGPMPGAPTGTGKCGDGTCDSIEKSSGLCLQDCK
ncbi:MAG: cellulase family glycosylhydrolase [Candidatus Niyogibacteria bacterium]|nr:cellulase family glycosylhydrolase [Candidatus Niyogibacteria bacterium]